MISWSGESFIERIFVDIKYLFDLFCMINLIYWDTSVNIKKAFDKSENLYERTEDLKMA